EVVAVDGRHQYLAGLEVGGDEDVVLHARPGGVGGDRVGQVSGRGARRDLEAQLARPGKGDGDHAVLERARRVQGVVLDPELAQAQLGGQAVGPKERCEAGPEI